MYSIRAYAGMIYDTRRLEAYQRALQLIVNPDSVVVDIGTGLGIFAFLACRAGARKVYAIEPSAVIAVARELAATNGYLQRIEFIEDISTRVTLPGPADVIVSDMAGAIPLYQQHLPSIADARKRLLKPHGTLIPRSDTLWAAVVNAEAVHARIAPSIDRSLGLDMRPAWKMAANVYSNTSFTEAQLATAAQRLAILDYSQIEDPNLHTQVQWDVTHPGQGHGISVWFDRTLADGVFFSTAPGQPEMIYGALFLPWPEPVKLNETDTIVLDISADLGSEDYIWRWNTTVFSGAQVKYKFRQSDFLGEPRSPARLRKQSATHVPRLNGDGELDRLILQLMDGKNAIEDIAREARRQFPALFQTLEQAIGKVADLSRKYSL
jgi:protein arginine N-methyltransferase 1